MANKLFSTVRMEKPNKNVFDLSHDVKMSFNMGYLVPSMVLECIPGDKFNISCDSLLRFAPLVSPVFHRMDVYMHYFFVPNRLIWPNWEKFITNTPVNGALPAFPTVTLTDANATMLHDYMGLPVNRANGLGEQISALALAAYQKIYNDLYRDQNLVNEVFCTLEDGDNTAHMAELSTIRKRAWEHDYLTSALPFAQKGAAVSLPLGDVGLKDDWENFGTPKFRNEDGVIGTPGLIPAAGGALAQGAYPSNAGELHVGGGADKAAYDPDGSLEVQSTTINDLRKAFRLQEWLEKAARGGSRYVENILAHFGVKSSDKRLQRAEYITGTKSPVMISEVLNTSDTPNAPQGTQAGHGISVTQGQYGNYFCEEHGYIIGIVSVMPKTAYMDGIPKHWLKFNDPFQYYWPSFANIGEQEILNREVYAFTSDGDGTFGYIPRYAEYKYEANRVAGDFRTNLDFWHLARKFATPPALNQQFVECDPDPRIFAVTDPTVQKLYCQILHKIRAVRAMPKFGNPTF